MSLRFYKYQGTGNDFIMVDDREQAFERNNHQFIEHLCHRRFGIGADGLILLQNDPEYDFKMVYFNADGYEGTMCGNGGRCIVQFAHDLKLCNEKTTFIAVDGEHDAEVKNGLVHLKMGNVSTIEKGDDFYFMDTGSPHYVAFKEELDQLDVYFEGQKIRYNNRFKTVGTNVNFVEQIGIDSLSVRTYERGVEDETYACGTGVTACVIASYLSEKTSTHAKVKVLGGELEVKFNESDRGFENIWLIGPAKRVFQGQLS